MGAIEILFFLYCQLRTRLLPRYETSNVEKWTYVKSHMRRTINCQWLVANTKQLYWSVL